LKFVSVFTEVTHAGRLFQRRGAATPKARSPAVGSRDGLTENAGRENDGPSKLQGMKLQDVKLADQFAGHEIAGHENDGPNCRT